jgi:hypothetical protein
VEVEQPARHPAGLVGVGGQGQPHGVAPPVSYRAHVRPAWGTQRCIASDPSPWISATASRWSRSVAGRPGRSSADRTCVLGSQIPNGNCKQQELDELPPGSRSTRSSRRPPMRTPSGSCNGIQCHGGGGRSSASPAGVAPEYSACLPAGRASSAGVQLDLGGRRWDRPLVGDRAPSSTAELQRIHRKSSRAPVSPTGRVRRVTSRPGAGHDARLEQGAGQLAVGHRPGRGRGVLEDRLPPCRGLGEPDRLAHRRLQYGIP